MSLSIGKIESCYDNPWRWDRYNLLEEEDLAFQDAFVGVTGYDEQNLLMALVAKQSGVNKIIAKISRPNYVHI